MIEENPSARALITSGQIEPLDPECFFVCLLNANWLILVSCTSRQEEAPEVFPLLLCHQLFYFQIHAKMKRLIVVYSKSRLD